ncbi:hypothetical protein P5V93_15010 [Mycobacteroides abscessus subsp. abscessus]|uniref:hypothetical protein n=1 Tax=Mycobacteroides abscessus TaxID=36809 RepID=UPI000927C604|nr:hypothetical protein [Mycobacteroides abscessus]AWG52259.1 hypothetical protein DDT48_24725 [Mycobacteroides abscessus]MBN7551081.1 hypothetical protein [Mycobacteroides abscessus subsp. abscessus]MDO3099781.1 hypothetical protein [Mycobacteroides abscessus subsp. abscessus]MDO3187547.1 hypothetical protein [Mycobacteroides abscessus subsp. abscessus]MDO3192409.1 hypothetical protein [Mycobacteroides abscessus subsp. abscessus]
MTNSPKKKREHIPLAWKVDPKPPLNDEVYDTFEIKRLGWFGRQIRVTGQCPYCFGDFTYVHTLKLVPSVVAPSGQGSGAVDVHMECPCAHHHTGAPDSGTGCGQSWTIEVTR